MAECDPCPPGKFAAVDGSSRCSNCTVGTFTK